MTSSGSETVHSAVDVDRVVRAARGVATSLGFRPDDAAVVALATRELGTNLVRYARGGRIASSAADGGSGIQIESHDLGPGIPDVPRAMVDGYTTGGGLGGGLGAVRRLMDDFSIESTPAGTHIVARKWLTRAP